MYFGTLEDGQTVERYTLRAGDISLEAITYGASIVSIVVPDRTGRLGNVVLSFENLDQYVRQGDHRGYFGATIGRYANRIAGARFQLNGKTHVLSANEGRNCLHGGARGFDSAVWQVVYAGDTTLELTHSSPDGDQGFPGRLDVRLTYRLNERGLQIDYSASAHEDTIVNLTNHSYFNLRASGTVEDQVVQIFASAYTPADADNIPTGEIAAVQGTPLDFRTPKRIGAHAYDANFVLDKNGEGVQLAAVASDPVSGRVMEVHTTQPGLQFYTGNVRGFAMETQHFPDSPHHDSFPATVLRAAESASWTTLLLFAAANRAASRAEGSPSV